MPVVQLLLAAAVCFALWRYCRAQSTIVAAGFLIRAFAGEALFWISYLHLPIARSLQQGDGFWFFAVDGRFFMEYATSLVAQGPAAILFLGDAYPSRFFVQVLSLFVAAFGGVPSVAILLNCVAYLLTCAIVQRLSQNRIVLAAIAFGPGSILFSLQPLKDTLFMLLIAALILAFRRWEESLRDGASAAPLLLWAAAILGVTYALAGIRWYFAVIFWGASAVFCVFTTVRAQRKAWAFVANAVLFVLLAQSIRFGALDTPASVVRLLNPATAVQWRPATAVEHIAVVRTGFESTPGATTIAAGSALAPSPAAPVAPKRTATRTPKRTRTAATTQTAAPAPTSEPTATSTATQTATTTSTAAPIRTAARTTPRASTAEPTPASTPTSAPTLTSASTETSAPAPTSTAVPGRTARRTPTRTPMPPLTPVPVPAPASAPAAESAPAPVAPVLLPQTFASRLTTGFAAMFLPRVIAESVGLIHVGGGRGMWLFAELDTLVFDLLLLYAIVHCTRSLRSRRARVTATFVLGVIVFVIAAGAMMYAVSNFGTLFRLRLMVSCLAAILPITLRTQRLDALQ